MSHKKCLKCNGGDIFAALEDNLKKGRWMVVGVPDGGPSFSYSVGAPLIAPNLPEVIITGISPDKGGMLINDLLLSIQRGEETLRTDEPYLNLANFPLYLRKLTLDQIVRHMTITLRVHQDPFEAYQMIYPDPKGVFPWEPGYDFPKQEILYLEH